MMKSNAQSPADTTSLALAATAIFTGQKKSIPITSINREVTISAAKMRQLGLVLEMIKTLLDSLDGEVIMGLVELIADTQTNAIKEGKDPNDIDIQSLTAQELVTKAKTKVNMLASVTAAIIDLLPSLVMAMSDITAEEYDMLELDEGVMVAGAIFMLNYSFFSQSLPPILQAFMATWASKNPAKIAPLEKSRKAFVKRR